MEKDDEFANVSTMIQGGQNGRGHSVNVTAFDEEPKILSRENAPNPFTRSVKEQELFNRMVEEQAIKVFASLELKRKEKEEEELIKKSTKLFSYEDLIINQHKESLIKAEKMEAKYESTLLNLLSEREAQRIANDLKHEKEMQEIRKELENERRESKKEKIDLEARYMESIQKLQIEREEERIKNDKKLEKMIMDMEAEKKELKEEKRELKDEKKEILIKLEAKLDDKEKEFKDKLQSMEIKMENKEKEYEEEIKKQEQMYKEEINSLLMLPHSSIINKNSIGAQINEKNDDNNNSNGSNSNSNKKQIIIVPVEDGGDSDIKSVIKEDKKDAMNNEDEKVAEDPNADDSKEEKVESVGWRKLFSNSVILKFESFSSSSLCSILAFVLVVLCVEKDWGLINVISNATTSNHFFVCISINRIDNFVMIGYFAHQAFNWTIMCIINRFIFPNLMGMQYLDGTNAEASPSSGYKACIIIIMFISNYFSQVYSFALWYIVASYVKREILPGFLKVKGNDNPWYILKFSFRFQFQSNLQNWFMYVLILSIGSVANIPRLNPSVEIFIFGYCFPFIKASVATLLNSYVVYVSNKSGWSAEKISQLASSISSFAIILCTLAQLYVVFKAADDYGYFLSQYLPHEFIKKLSWLTFHPLYLKTKLQIMAILSSLYNTICNKKERVEPIGSHRYSTKVWESIGATAGDIIGRQWGEDCCMISITLWMLPISQEYLFSQVYQTTSNDIVFPSYQNIGIMIIAVAFGLETIMTIVCFSLLLKVGIPLNENTQIFKINSMSVGLGVFSMTSFLLVLTATFIY